MEKREWILVVAIIILVAIVSSFAFVSISGNVIKVDPKNKGTEVYTKAEVDAKLNTLSRAISALETKLNSSVNPTTSGGNNLMPINFKTDAVDPYTQRSQDDNGAVLVYETRTNENGVVSLTRSGGSVVVNTDNNQFAYVTFTSARAGSAGEQKITFVYDKDTSSTAVDPVLAHQITYNNRGLIHPVEGESAQLYDWIISDNGDSGVIIGVEDISIDTPTMGSLTLVDEITGEAQKITLTNVSGVYQKAGVNMFGGNGYNLAVPSDGRSVQLTWGSGSSPGNAGSETTLAPKIKLTNGDWISIGQLSKLKGAYNLNTTLSENTLGILYIENTAVKGYIFIPIGKVQMSEIAIASPMSTTKTTGI
jgi:hypothetical protein